LLNILPEETAQELKQTGKAKARAYDNVTVLFTDFKGFSKMAETMSAEALVGEIDYYFRAFDRIIKPFGIEKIKTIGDAYMAACGVPVANPYHALNVIRAAMKIREFCSEEAEKRRATGKPFFEIRIGVNSGSLVAGIVGESKFAYDIWGDTVNMAARMEQSGVPGKVNVTEDTYVLIRDKFECVHRGKLSVKHKDDVEMYFVESEISEPSALLDGKHFAPDGSHPLLKNAIQTEPNPAHKPTETTKR
jgi:class 3 adenylate cyclase